MVPVPCSGRKAMGLMTALPWDSTPLKGVILGGLVGSGAVGVVGVVGVVAVGVCAEPSPDDEDPPEPLVSQQDEPSEEKTVSRPESAWEACPCRDICSGHEAQENLML